MLCLGRLEVSLVHCIYHRSSCGSSPGIWSDDLALERRKNKSITTRMKHQIAETFRAKRTINHSTKKPVTTMLTYPWKCTVLHCSYLGNTWKPLVLMTRHFDYCQSASEGDNQSVRSSAPVVSRGFPGGYNVKLYISRGSLAWWLLAFLHSEHLCPYVIA